MQLFELVSPRLFRPLAGPNRAFYAELLLLLWEECRHTADYSILRAEAVSRAEDYFAALAKPLALDADDAVLLQGVVDAWFETKDGLVIVDYKTDRIRPDAVPERTAYYAAQLRAYAGAMARITGRPVCRRTLYFLHCGCSADVPETDA